MPNHRRRKAEYVPGLTNVYNQYYVPQHAAPDEGPTEPETEEVTITFNADLAVQENPDSLTGPIARFRVRRGGDPNYPDL